MDLNHPSHELYDLDRHLILSGSLAYQLTAADKNTLLQNVHRIILDGCYFSETDSRLLLDSLDYIRDAYGNRHRRLGPPAVLHPIRATAMMARAVAPSPDILDLLGVLFHDKLEDLPESEYRNDSPGTFDILEERFHAILDRIEPADKETLKQRLAALTIKPGQTYNAYVADMLDHAVADTGTLRCKLADRLDNTMDMRLDYQDTLHGTNFYKVIFNTMLSLKNPATPANMKHPIKSEMNGEQRLRQLFKNIVLLSLIRRSGKFSMGQDSVIDELCSSLVTATSLEAQRNILHIFNFHMTDVSMQRDAIRHAMEYCQHGGIEKVTSSSENYSLDGLFQYFARPKSSAVNCEKFMNFYDNKQLMVQACFAFMAICARFNADPDFYVQGITRDSISPEDR